MLLQHGYHIFGCVHHIDMCLTFLLYQYRSCESEANATMMERVHYYSMIKKKVATKLGPVHGSDALRT